MYHPIRYVRSVVQAAQLAYSNLQNLILRLTFSIDRNTAATAALLETATATLRAAEATQTATSYLAAAEQHRREQAGLRHEF